MPAISTPSLATRSNMRLRAAAAAARKRMFDRVASDGVLIAGMHVHFPSFSRLKRKGDAYELIAEPWVHAFE